MDQCESRDNIDRYMYDISSGSSRTSGNGNSSQMKSSPDNKKAKIEADEDDWSD